MAKKKAISSRHRINCNGKDFLEFELEKGYEPRLRIYLDGEEANGVDFTDTTADEILRVLDLDDRIQSDLPI